MRHGNPPPPVKGPTFGRSGVTRRSVLKKKSLFTQILHGAKDVSIIDCRDVRGRPVKPPHTHSLKEVVTHQCSPDVKRAPLFADF